MTKEKALQKAKLYREWATKRIEKGIQLQQAHSKWTKDFDFTEPIKIGHHSEKRHRAVLEKRDNEMRAIIDNEKVIKRMLEKADNLERFANTNKGDAERRREKMREELDKIIKVGDVIVTMYGDKEVLKVNKKTYTVQGSSSTFTIPKHLIMGSKIKK